MLNKAARRRAKKAKATITMPAGAAPVALARIPGQHKPKEPPMQTVLDARARMLGKIADQVDLRSAMAGYDLGRALLKADVVRLPSGRPDPIYSPGALWDAASHMCRTFTAFGKACGAPSRFAKCLSILTPPDHMEATAETPAWDDRPQEDRDRAAVAAYMAMQGWLDHCDRPARSACLRAVVDDAGVSDLPGIVLALQCVVDGNAGRKIVWRGR